jgi:hypothetical protein
MSTTLHTISQTPCMTQVNVCLWPVAVTKLPKALKLFSLTNRLCFSKMREKKNARKNTFFTHFRKKVKMREKVFFSPILLFFRSFS